MSAPCEEVTCPCCERATCLHGGTEHCEGFGPGESCCRCGALWEEVQ